jgi:heme exporter protein A
LACGRGDHRLFSDLDFLLQAGELLHIRGSNGSGKTTLLRTLCGLTKPDAGGVYWSGERIEQVREQYAARLVYLGHLNGIKEDLSGHENLALALRLSGKESDARDVDAALAEWGLRGREDLPVKVLSQGQKRRVALARLRLQKADLWILDEPFTALDARAVTQLRDLIEQQLGGGGMVVLTTHQAVDFQARAIRTIDLEA